MSPFSPARRARTCVAVFAVAAFGTLTGCTPPTTPAEVVWAGRAPDGQFESSPWVKALREADLQLQSAINTHDFATAAVADVVSESVRARYAHTYRTEADGEDFAYSPGPTPMIVLAVDEAGADKAVVSACISVNWSISAQATTPPSTLDGRVVEFTLQRLDDDTLQYSAGGSSLGEKCDLAGVSIGLFDPQPDTAQKYSPDDVKGP